MVSQYNLSPLKSMGFMYIHNNALKNLISTVTKETIRLVCIEPRRAQFLFNA